MHKVVIGYEIFDQISYCSKYYIKVVAFCKHRNKYANGSFNSMCTTKTVWCIRLRFMDPVHLNHTSPIRQMSVSTQGEKKRHGMVGIRHL